MSDILNILEQPHFDNSITKKEYHSYTPFVESFKNNDEIRISIQNQDLYILPSESFIYIEGTLRKSDGTVLPDFKLNNNCIAFSFDEIRYELNGIEIDRTRNVGITTSLKNYISLNKSESAILYNAGWSPKEAITPTSGYFSFCIRLSSLLGFPEDCKKVIPNARHELIFNRAKSDENALQTSTAGYKFEITKMVWKVPHISVDDRERLKLLKITQSAQIIQLSFRSWDLFEYPNLPQSNHVIWTVKTSTQLEKPRFVIFALQTDRQNKSNTDASKFDHCKLANIKVHLNSETYPYDNLNINYDRNQYGLLYDMYAKFQESYYGRENQPMLDWNTFKSEAPIVVIDCSHQNEAIKAGPVDVRVEFETVNGNAIPANTSAFCLLLHDRIIEYSPLSGEVRKLV